MGSFSFLLSASTVRRFGSIAVLKIVKSSVSGFSISIACTGGSFAFSEITGLDSVQLITSSNPSPMSASCRGFSGSSRPTVAAVGRRGSKLL